MTQHRILLFEFLKVHGSVAAGVPGPGGHGAQFIGNIVGDHVFRHQVGLIAPDAQGGAGNKLGVIGHGIVGVLARAPLFKDPAVLVDVVEGVLGTAVGGRIPVVAEHIVEEGGVEVINHVVALVDEGLQTGHVPVPLHIVPEVDADIVVHLDNLGRFGPGVFSIVDTVVKNTGSKALGMYILCQIVDILGQNVLPLGVFADGLFGVLVEHGLILGGKGGAVEFHVFVAADVEVGAALKELHILVVQAVDILHGLVIGHVQAGSVVIAGVADLAVFRVGLEDLVHMARTVEGGDDLNAVFPGFLNNFTNLFVGQIFIGNNGGVGLALNAEAQVLGEVHFQGVQLQERHFPNLAEEPLLGEVLSAAVYKETALGQVRIIDDGAIGQALVGHHVILDGAQGIHHGVFAGAGNLHAILADVNAIGFLAVGFLADGVLRVHRNQHIRRGHILFVGIHHGKGVGGYNGLVRKLGINQLHHFGQALVFNVGLVGQDGQPAVCRHRPSALGLRQGVLLDHRVHQGGQLFPGHRVSGCLGGHRSQVIAGIGRRLGGLYAGKRRTRQHHGRKRCCQDFCGPLFEFLHVFHSFPFLNLQEAPCLPFAAKSSNE